jgi:hypothetical protein
MQFFEAGEKSCFTRPFRGTPLRGPVVDDDGLRARGSCLAYWTAPLIWPGREPSAAVLEKASNLFAASRATSLQRADNVLWETYNSRFRNATRGHSTSHSAPRDFPLGASRLPTRKSATSHSEGCDFRVGASQIPRGNPTRSFRPASGTFKSRLEKRVGARGERLARGGEGGGSRGEAALAVSHSAARVGGSPLPCARHFLWGTFLPFELAVPFELAGTVGRPFELQPVRTVRQLSARVLVLHESQPPPAIDAAALARQRWRPDLRSALRAKARCRPLGHRCRHAGGSGCRGPPAGGRRLPEL